MGFPNFQTPGLQDAIRAAIAAGGTRDMTSAPPPSTSAPYTPGPSVPQTQAQRNATPDPTNNYVQSNQGLEGASSGDFANAMTSGQGWNMISSSPQGYNSAQYADPRFAQALAQNLGGSVLNTRNIGPPGAGDTPSQPNIDFGGGFASNAGLLGQQFAKYSPDVAMRMLQDEMKSSGGGFNPASQNNSPTGSMFQEQTNTGPTQMNAAFGQAAGGPMNRVAANNPVAGQSNVQTPQGNPLAQQGMWGQGGGGGGPQYNGNPQFGGGGYSFGGQQFGGGQPFGAPQQGMFGGGFGGPMPFQGGNMFNQFAGGFLGNPGGFFNEGGTQGMGGGQGGGYGSPMGQLGGMGGNMGGLSQMMNMLQQLRQQQGFRRRPQMQQRRPSDSNYFSRFG